MNKPDSKKRKIVVRVAILLLVVAFWVLGDAKRNYWIKDSPDGRFSTSLVAHRGWRHTYWGGVFYVYVRDNTSGETILATTHPENCVFEQIDLEDIKWEKDSHRFICFWAIQYNGVHKQYFQVATGPLRIKASPPCCGA